jgi:simple sugar transport system permease protein
MRDGFALERRLRPSTARDVATYGGGLVAGLAAIVATLVAVGVPVDTIGDELVVQVFAEPDGLAQTVTLAIPLVLLGLAATAALRIRFWNIGLDGQLWVGAIAACGVALHDVGPESVRLPLMLAAAAAGGAAWIALPLVLRVRLGVSETVVTLLLANIAWQGLQHLLFGAWRDPASSFPVSPPFDPTEQFALLGAGNVHGGLWVALAAALACSWLVARTPLGFHALAVGLNPLAARATGVPVTTTLVACVLLSGALAGLAGGVVVTGMEHRLTQFIGLDATFAGIVVACVARLQPAAVVPAALLLAGFQNAGATLKVFHGLSEAIVLLMQGLLLAALLAAEFFARYRLVRVRGGEATLPSRA